MPEDKKKKAARDKKFNAKPAEKKRRAKRNAARRKLMKEGKVKKGDGKDVDHIKGVQAGNGKKNLRVLPKSKNRGRKGKDGKNC